MTRQRIQPTFTHMRRPDWSVRWTEFMKDSIDLAQDLKLDWDSEEGGITCTSWCADGVEALTGVNPFDEWRGRFTGVLSAVKSIRAEGFQTLDDLIASMFAEIPVGMAQTGDLVCCLSARWNADHPEGPLFLEEVMPHGIALVDPPHFYAVTEQGLAKGDLYKEGVRAFAVGRRV